MKNFACKSLIVAVLGIIGCADHDIDRANQDSDLTDTRELAAIQQATDPAATTGTLPPVGDPSALSAAGPFAPAVPEKNVGPNKQYTTVTPKNFGAGGVKHPILIWGPGAGAFPEIYATLLLHVASHGFFIVSYNSTPQGPELTKAIDWILAEAKRADSPYYDKLDTSKIAMGGQSAGSLGTFNVAKDERLTTTLHINGGTFAPHTAVKNLIKPALFLCGEAPSGGANSLSATVDIARPNCDIDFKNATVPVWYGAVNKSGHTTVIDNPLGPPRPANDPLLKPYLAATVAWLRWQIGGDQTLKSLFVGPTCGFCTDKSTWTIQQKGLQ